MNSVKEIISNLSLVRLSGVKDFILLEINGSLVKMIYLRSREPFYEFSRKLLDKFISENEKIFNFSDDFDHLSIEVKKFIDSCGITEPVILAGINDYKYTPVSVPAEIESEDGGEEIWFSENSSRFLPEGSSPDSFSFSYEKIKEDENFKTCSLIIARKDYINRITASLSSLKAAAVFPFVTSVSFPFKNENENILVIDFSSNKINYSFRNKDYKFYSGDIYSNLYNKPFDPGERTINYEELISVIKEIRNFLNASFPGLQQTEISLYICCTMNDYPVISGSCSDILESAGINEFYRGKDPFFVTSYLALNKFINHFDSSVNLIGEKERKLIRDRFEKQAGLRIVLSLGIILISLLVFSYSADMLLSSVSAEKETVEAENDLNRKQILLLEKENTELSGNLSLLLNLKEFHPGFSTLLLNLAETINSGCRLTEIKIAEVYENHVQISLKGVSASQGDVALFIKALEENGFYKNISLVSVSSEIKKGITTDNQEFYLTAEYSVNNKMNTINNPDKAED